MARHIWTVVCSASAIDTETNSVSLFNVVERISLAESPPQWPIEIPIGLEIVSLWCRSDYDSPEEAQARIVVEGPTRITDLEPYTINLSGEFLRFRHRTRVLGISLNQPGVVWFVVQQHGDGTWNDVARVPLEFHLATGDK